MPSPKESRLFDCVCRFLDRGFAAHIVLLVVLGLCIYSSAIFHPFVHDDVVFILKNLDIGRWDNIADAFLRPSVPDFFHGLVTPYYRPVLEVLYRLQFLLFGANAAGFHFFNILVHIANAILVYAVSRRLIRTTAPAFAVALLFLVHPVQTEAVACVSGISNLVCCFFILGAFYYYLRAREGGQEGERSFAVSFVLFILALLSKEQAVVFPFFCLAYEVFADKRQSSSAKRVLLMFAALAGYMFIRHALFGGFASTILENTGELKLRLLAIPGTIGMYVKLLFLPTGLHYYRSIDILAPYAGAWAAGGLAVVLLVLALRPLPSDQKKLAWFALAWFAVALGPVLNIIPLVHEYSFVVASEHNLYLPSVGIFLFFSILAGHYANGRRLLTGVSIAAVLVLSALSFNQNSFWKNEIVLFERSSQMEPRLGRVRILLAKAYFQAGRMDEAIGQYAEAEKIMSGYAGKTQSPKARRFYEGMLKGIYSDSAQSYAFKRDFVTSVGQYDKAIALDPGDSYLYSNRALSLIGAGDMPGGIKDLEKALSLNPDNLLAANNLSICYIQQGNAGKAKGLLEWILTKDPGLAAARDNLNKLNSVTAGRPQR